MSCPKCGLATLPEQKFCRSCGTSLQMSTQPLAEPTTGSQIQPNPVFEHEAPRASRLMLWGFIVMFLGAAVGVIGKKLMHDEIVTVVGILASLAGIFLTVYPYLSPSRRRNNEAATSSQPEVGTGSQKDLLQESATEYIPSITERTTDLLKKSAATRPRQ